MKITVVGPGRWGSFIAWYLDSIGHKVTLYGKRESEKMQEFNLRRKNDYVELPTSLELSTNLESLITADVIIISVNAQGLRRFFEEIEYLEIKDKIFVLCMKGIEISTGMRLSEIADECLDPSNKVAVWLGPGHPQEFVKGIPNCMVIDSKDEATKTLLVDEFGSNLIRFYYGTDLLGNEIGGAAKNVVGIAAGILDGLGLTTLKGALMTRAPREYSRLVEAMGGNILSVYGLCHLGDYEATVFSQYSNNRRFGENFAKGESFYKLAEGCHTVKALKQLGRQYDVDLPITNAIDDILYHHTDPKTTLEQLFTRSQKKEF